MATPSVDLMIACDRSYDGECSTELYYVYPLHEPPPCTYDLLCGIFGDEQHRYAATKAVFEDARADFMATLTPVEDVTYADTISYHLYNGCDSKAEIRFSDIAEAFASGQWDIFQIQAEYKRTSDMVADALYEAYMAGPRGGFGPYTGIG